MSTMSFMPLETLPLTKITQSALLRGQVFAYKLTKLKFYSLLNCLREGW
jgi:hypothetical protein